jgi:hypothetical protein
MAEFIGSTFNAPKKDQPEDLMTHLLLQNIASGMPQLLANASLENTGPKSSRDITCGMISGLMAAVSGSVVDPAQKWEIEVTQAPKNDHDNPKSIEHNILSLPRMIGLIGENGDPFEFQEFKIDSKGKFSGTMKYSDDGPEMGGEPGEI